MKRLTVILVAAAVATVACGSSSEETTVAAASEGQTSSSGAGVSSTGSGASSGTGGSSPDAVTAFYDDFHASRFSMAKTDAKGLDDAMKADPEAGDLSIVHGLSHLWHLAEIGRSATMPDASELQAEGAGLLAAFTAAKQNNPDDGRVDCWLGLSQLGAGTATGNDSLVQQGYATIEEGVAKYPEFNLFCRALAYAALPATDPDYSKAVDALFDTLDVCFDTKVDRANPDITSYLGLATDQGPKRVCWNDAVAPHGAEGFYLYFGDLLVKQGNVDVAKIVFANVKLIKEYDAWPYKSLLEARLGSDLTAKAALYQDADPTNDPPLAGDETNHGCTYCHAATAAE